MTSLTSLVKVPEHASSFLALSATAAAIAYFVVTRGRPLVDAPVQQVTAVPMEKAAD